MIIDANNLVLGRMAAVAAKQALLGEDVKIVNCEKAIITGSRKYIIKRHLVKNDMGQPRQGPNIQKRSDFYVRRAIKGMLPVKQPRGKEAYAKIKCYIGVPEGMDKAETLKVAQPSVRGRKNNITVKELCMHIGGKA